MRSFSRFVLISLVFSLLCLTGMVSAQEPDQIIGMTLETNDLSLNIGESYRFLPDFQTVGETGFTNGMVHIYSSDANVVEVSADPEEYNTITAVGGGSAKLFLFSAGYEASAVCSVTVAGPANETVGKDASWNNPTAAEMKKLQDPGLKAFFETLAKPEMANAAPALAANTEFNALATVSTGKAGDMAALAEELGMSPVYAFPVIDTIGVTGTADQFLALLKNKNVLFIIENQRYSVNDTSDRHMFEGQAEALSHISAAGEAGLTGAGTVVAIVDTGIDKNHEQFTGKKEGSIIAEACFSASGEQYGIHMDPVCVDNPQGGMTENLTTSAIGSQVRRPGEFEHGTHVAAIAAGKDGVAPAANIVAVNIFYEGYYYNNQGNKEEGAFFNAEELFRAFEYFKSKIYLEDGRTYWVNSSYAFASINMSLGGGKYTAACKKTTTNNYEADTETYFADFLNLNIVPVVAAGNNGFDKAISWPACAPSGFAVGALHDSAVPEVAGYSNHSAMVDIMAPGTQIYSALPNWNHDANSYEAWNGTSMATPFVAGTFALMREAFPEKNAEELKALITGTTSQIAVRAGVKKPVLDLAAITSFYKGPDISVFGGDKSLELTFAATPYKTSYLINIYTLNNSGNEPTISYLKNQKASNPKKVSIKSLINNQPYFLEITGEAVFGKTKIPINTVAYGMPMTQGKGYALSSVDDGTSVKFSWTPENGYNLYATYGPSPDNQPDYNADAHNQTVPAVANRPFYATLYKSKIERGITYWSLPTALDIVPLSAPKLIGYHFENKVYYSDTEYVYAKHGGNGKAWLQYEANRNITGREVTVYTLDNNLQRMPKPKTLTVITTKSPEDVIITGLKNGYLYEVCTRNVAKLGKNTSTSEPDCQYVFPRIYNWDPNDYNGNTELYWWNQNLDRVTMTSGSQKAVLTFNPDMVVDGYRFELKPLVPNGTRTIYDVKLNQAQGSYTFNKLTDGTVYKLRFMSYIKNGKLTALSTPWPDNKGTQEGDATWRGMVFVPLPEPEVQVSTRIDDPDTGESKKMNVKIRVNPAADGFVIAGFTGRTGDTNIAQYVSEWDDPAAEYQETGNTYLVSFFTTISIFLYKDFDGARYYGPEVRFSNVSNAEWSYKYGPKSADDVDLSMFPEFRYAPQINGQINGQFSFTELTAAKSAEDAFETEEPLYAADPDSFIAEFDKNGSVSLDNVQIFYFDSDSDTAEIDVEEGSAESASKSLSEPVPQDNSPFTLYVIGN